MVDSEHYCLPELFDCSVEVLAKIDMDTIVEVVEYCSITAECIGFWFDLYVLDTFLSFSDFAFPKPCKCTFSLAVKKFSFA